MRRRVIHTVATARRFQHVQMRLRATFWSRARESRRALGNGHCASSGAPDTLVDFHPGSASATAASPSGAPGHQKWPRPGSRRCVSIPRRTATTRCPSARCSGGTATFYMIYQQQHNVEGARGGRAATPAPTYCGTTTARSARSTSRRGRRRAATTRRPTNWSCGTTSTTATLPCLLRRRRRGNFLSITSSRKALLATVRH